MVFKVGDLVECIETGGGPEGQRVESGVCYAIAAIRVDIDTGTTFVSVFPSPYEGAEFFEHRFKFFDEVYPD